jgi:hypothetical protein
VLQGASALAVVVEIPGDFLNRFSSIPVDRTHNPCYVIHNMLSLTYGVGLLNGISPAYAGHDICWSSR